jgi:hypothetical protein
MPRDRFPANAAPSSALPRSLLDDLLANSIKPNAARIAEIFVRGEIAVLLHEIGPGDLEGEDTGRALGWDGRTPVFELDAGMRMRLAEDFDAHGDAATARWFRDAHCGRILVLISSGFLFVDHDLEAAHYRVNAVALERPHAKA